MPISVCLPKEIEERLNNLAKRTGRTKTYYVREAIVSYIEDLEDYYLAEDVMVRVYLGEEETTPLEEVMSEYGLES